MELIAYIDPLENALGKKAEIELLPLQVGDVLYTYADVEDLVEQFHHKPATRADDGIARFLGWCRYYFKV